MGESVGTRQLNFQIPARVNNVIVTAVTNVATQVALPLVMMDRYMTLENDSDTVHLYYLVGPAGTTPTPAPATTGGPNVAGAAGVVPPNSSVRFRLQNNVDGVIGYVTSAGATTARLYASSNQEGYALGNPPGQA